MDNKNHWEQIGADYSRSWTSPAKAALSAKELDFVGHHLAGDCATVLDVGIGNGRILEHLLRSTDAAQLYGVDIADSMVGTCRRRFEGEARVVSLSVCDISTDPIPFDVDFDFISAIRVLKYSQNWADVVGHLFARLSPRGALVFTMPNRGSISRFSRPYAVAWATTTRRDLLALADDLGAETVGIEGFSRLPFAAYNLDRPAWLSSSVIAGEEVLRRTFGATLFTRELFVALRPAPRTQVRRASGQVVTTDPGAGVVEKAFVADASSASHEFGALLTLSAVVDDVAGTTSPHAVELLPGPPPAIRMERLGGRPFLEVLGRTRLGADRRRDLASRAASVLTGYVAATGEAYADFQFDNMLYDVRSDTLAFVDLGEPAPGSAPLRGLQPLERSLGNLVGSTVYQSARPKWLTNRRQHRQARALCEAIVDDVTTAAPASVSPSAVLRAAGATYRRCAFGGSWPKRLWYTTGGYVLATRVRVANDRFGPSIALHQRGEVGAGPDEAEVVDVPGGHAVGDEA